MLLTVFGAGASYDSSPALRPERSAQWRPPLANQLFEERFAGMLRMFPKSLPIVPYLLKPVETVERTLQGLLDEAASYPEGLSQLMALRYYFHYMLWEVDTQWEAQTQGVSNYKTLIDQILRWTPVGDHISFVTFNYDRLLEFALQVFDLTVKRISDYVTHRRFRVYKLHGSVDWARELEVAPDSFGSISDAQTITDLIAQAPALTPSDRFVIADTRPMARVRSAIVVPAIAIPVERAKVYECPSGHIEGLVALLPRVEKLLLIGWRAADKHFLDLLVKHQTQKLIVTIVAGDSAKAREVEANIRAAGLRAGCELFGGGFSDFVTSRAGKSFLSA